jgi:hypothetical protein
MHMIRKCQVRWLQKGAIVEQVRFVESLSDCKSPCDGYRLRVLLAPSSGLQHIRFNCNRRMILSIRHAQLTVFALVGWIAPFQAQI